MSILSHLRSLADRFVQRDALERDLDEELRSHVAHRADDLERAGLDRAAAERQARVEFGGHARFKDEARDSVAGGAAEALLRDLRFSLRQLRKSPSFTVAAVVTLAAPPGFRGTVLVFTTDFFVPLVEQPALDGTSLLEARGNRWLTVFGRRKGVVTNAQAVADLDAIGAQLEAAYPKDNEKMTFALSRSTLGGDAFERPVDAFLVGLTLLAALILLAACANLGSLFAARAADHSREVALRIALGAGSARVLRQHGQSRRGPSAGDVPAVVASALERDVARTPGAARSGRAGVGRSREAPRAGSAWR